MNRIWPAIVLSGAGTYAMRASFLAFAHRMATVPQNQLMMQKLMVNQALYNMGLMGTQMIATVFDGITRHSPEGLNFKRRSEEKGWKHAVDERDQGTFDWTTNQPITQNR